MLSKRNYQERLRQMEQKTERFSIRKLTIGAASVLIGLSFLGFNAHTAHADTVKPSEKVVNASTVKSDDVQSKLNVTTSSAVNSSAAASAETKASQAPESQSAASSASSSAASSASEKVASSASSSAASSTTSEKASSAAKSEDAKATASSAAKDDNVITSNANGVITGKNSKGTWAAMDDSQGQTIAATNWNELANALNSSTVTTIDLQGEINVNSNSNATKTPAFSSKDNLRLTNNNISRTVTINGNGHTINFGDYYLTYSTEGAAGLTKGNRSKNSPWDVTFKNVTINANNTNPFGFDGNTNAAPKGDAYDNQKYDKVTFKDSTVTIKKGALINSDNVNVVFSGKNVITTQDVGASATITANSVRVENGETTINNATSLKANSIAGEAVGRNTIWVTPHNATDSTASYDSLTVDEGATLNINADAVNQEGKLINSAVPNQADLRGIVTSDFKTGTITINGNLNEDMGNGHSSAIMTGNLTIGKTGKVSINTKQDNEADGPENAWTNGVANYNGYHFAVVGLGVGKVPGIGGGAVGNAKEGSTLTDNGSLTIIRKDVPNNTENGNVFTPLIAYGAGMDNNIAPGNFKLSVGEGATLDLQDQATFQPTPAGQKVGMITMFGNAASDYVTFTKPAYVNLQRTGKQSGSLLRLEGNVNAKYDNIIQLNGVTPGGTPLSQWDTGNYTDNPSNTWRITNLTAHSANGNYAAKGFEPVKGSKDNYTVKFLNSNGAVTLVMDKTGGLTYVRNSDGQVINDPKGSAAQEVQLNNFLNNFNFWTPQRISFGNKAPVSQSIYAPTDVEQGTTKTVKPTVFNTPSDSPEQDQIKTTYAKTDDTPAWVSVDENTGELTLTPTADNSKVGMYNIPVQVTYTDQTNSGEGSTQTVLAPVFVTDGNESVVWPKDPEGNLNGAIVITTDPSALKAHETSDNNMDLKADAAVKSIDEYQMDTVNTISTIPTSIAKDSKGITISWGNEPSTVVSEATKGETIKGSVNVTFDKDSQPFTDQVVVEGDNYKTTSDLNIDAPGAVAQETAPATKVSASVGDKLTDTQFKELVNSSVPANEINHTTLQSVDKDNAVVRITFNDKDAQGNPTYLDVKVPASYIDTNSDAALYDPSYKPVNVNQGGTVETGVPSYDPKTENGVTINAGGKAPEENGNKTTYSIPEGTKLPEGVTATIDPSTGNVTVTTKSNTPEGPIFVPVTVNYPDGSNETIDAPIAVGSNTFIGTDYSVSVDTNLDNLHETTANSMNPDAKDAITKITWWNNNDVRAGKNLAGTVIYDKANGTGNLNDVTVEWTNPINTNVDKATMDEILPGSNTSTVSDANPAIKITYGTNSQLIKDTGNGLFPGGGSQIAKWYGNGVTVQGADAKNPAKAVDVTAGVNELTSDQVAALINTTNLDKLTANKPVSYTWATPLKKGDKTGTVKITFSDKAANGQATYLNVELPAGSINVTDGTGNPTTPTDTDKYDANGGNITVDKGHKLTDGDAEDAITNHTKLPEGTKYTWEYAPDTDTVGDKNGIVTVTYPAGKDGKTPAPQEVPVMVHVTDTDDADKYDPEGSTITIKKGDPVPDAQKGIENPSELPTGTKYTWDVAPDPEKVGNQPVIVTVTYPDGSVDKVPATVIVTDNNNGNPTTPTDADKYDPEGQVVTVNKGDKLPDASNGIANTSDLPEGTKYSWKTPVDTTTSGDKPAIVVVTYPDGSSEDVPTVVHVNPTDADKYTPEGQNITVDKGHKLTNGDAETAITNTKDLPEGTKYSWNGTPDTNTIGDHPAIVVVTYPDGSVDEVPVIVTVKDPNNKPANPTDADTYNPEGGTIIAKIGDDLSNDAPNGIVNKGDLPNGTSYTWTNGTPTTTESGLTLHDITVHYPDDSEEIVPAYVNVVSDADKYTPVPEVVDTNKGQVPDPEKGIANKGDLPNGTSYTWKDTPDVNTIGDHPAVVIVTYQDGSKDEVPTIVHVTDNNNGGNTNTGEPTVTNPTDADVYNPIGQDIPTKEGQVPDPSQGISNKDQLPGGTTYTWQDPGKVTDDVKHPGSHPEIIVVHYPDGSTDTVTVNVNVPTPEPKPIDTPQGVVPDPSKGIKNPDDMPDGTKYQWTNGTPDVSTPGTHEVSITVIYPDGTTDTITTTITVAPHATNNNNHGKTRNINEGAGVHSGNWYDENGRVHSSGLYDEYGNGVHSSFYGNGNGNDGQKTLPQTGAQANMAGVLGLMIASVGAILGLAADKKRKN